MSDNQTETAKIAEVNAKDGKSNKPQATKKKDKKHKSGGGNQSESSTNIQSSEQTPSTSELSSDTNNIGDEQLTADSLKSIDDGRLKALLENASNFPNMLSLMRSVAKTPEEAMTKTFKFWSTQPVPKFDEKIEQNEAIESDKPNSELRQEPYMLPAGFKWEELHLDDPVVLSELYTLLNENYVEDDDAMFRFDYQPEFLRWALQPPGWRREWHVGVRVEKSGLLVGFISAIPGKVRIYEKTPNVVEINFLCVHKKLRSKRVAPVLIREITRRVNLTGCFQAVFTAGVVLPKPISTCRYWHRSLNPKKLIQVRFERKQHFKLKSSNSEFIQLLF